MLKLHYCWLTVLVVMMVQWQSSGKVIDVHTDKSKVSDEPCPDWILNDCIRVCATNGYICRGNMCQCGPFRKRRTDGEPSGGYNPDGSNPGTGESNNTSPNGNGESNSGPSNHTSPYGNGESNSGPNGNGYMPNMPNDGMQFW